VITANKGEWSEFYVLLKLLIEKGFNGVDSDLKQIPGLFFSVLQVHGNDDNLIYELSDRNKILITSSDNSKLIDNKVVKERLDSILDTIVNTKERTFAIPEAEDLMEDILCKKIKSSSSEKGDIKLVFEEPQKKQIVTDYFSIKSFLAGKPTLLNASTHTIFTYKVVGLSSEQIAEINNMFNSNGSIDLTKRIEKIYEYGGKLEFQGMASNTMEKNLKKIDSFFHFEIARMLKDSYLHRNKKISELIKDSKLEDINRKMGEFLEAILKGMMPAIEWDLLNVANGLILVVNEGELVGFHLCNKRELIDYLVKDAYLDTPSTSRHKIGKIYSKQKENLFNLSLQIRLA
jgi:type II restriction enzyme